MGVVISPDSELGKELQKWEQFPRHHVDGTVIPAGNPYVKREYPKMLYKAQTWRSSGKALCFAPLVSPYGWSDPNQYGQAQLEADSFNTSCQRVVKSEGEHALAKGQGWCESPAEAMAQHEAEQAAIARAAAEAAFTSQRMSEKARAEFEAATEGSEHHVVDVQKPKRGRKPKAVAPMAEDA